MSEAAKKETDVTEHAESTTWSMTEAERNLVKIAGLPSVVDSVTWCESPPDLAPAIIDGLLRQGGKMVLGGSSKTRKTWTLTQLGLSIAGGLEFLGWQCKAAPVLYINLELPEPDMCRRVRDVADGLGYDRQGFHVWNLRGCAAPLEDLEAAITGKAKGYGAVIIDPVYKVLGERDENSNGDVALMLNCLERIAGNSGAAVIFAHHFAKGSQGGKFAVDRVSGAGAWWRDPDAGLFLTELESEDGFNVHAAARSFPPLDEFAARAEHPLMLRDDDLDHTALKQPGPQKKASAEQVRDLLSDGPLSFSDWHRAAKRELGLSEATFNRRRAELDEAETVQKDGDLYYQVTT